MDTSQPENAEQVGPPSRLGDVTIDIDASHNDLQMALTEDGERQLVARGSSVPCRDERILYAVRCVVLATINGPAYHAHG